ncbi:LuxR C-terminal-related transcriptional regulator [Nocardioides daeguensis]|uniref:LuxR C-terminal-related transcriptional regulator n=1 Tax=Nocardioides daeguensis TaxID=908359 RepID=A0ABP6V005_9ACTN
MVFGASRKRTARNADRAFRTRAVDLLAEAREALGCPLARWGGSAAPPWCPQALTAAADDCVQRAQAVALIDESTSRRLYRVAIAMQMLALEVQEEQLADRGRRLAGAADGLARLRGMATTDALMAAVCEEVARCCDFGRVVVSRVERSSWIPARAHFEEADESWFADWVDAGIPLTGDTPEARLLTERVPAAVYDTASTTVHRDIIVESGQSTSYVVAPMISSDTVVGFFHADYFPSDRHIDDADRDLLGTFADGVMRLYSGLAHAEQLEMQRERARRAMESIDALGRTAWSAPARITARPEVTAELTTRELEVLDLIVQGATNRDIGERLVIAEDTVKSHVKQILRKLGVANRAQAIACAAGTPGREQLAYS